MPSENVVLVRSAVDALNRGAWDEAFAWVAPGFEYDLTRTASPVAGIHPLASMRRVVDEFLEPWQSYSYEPRELTEVGEHVVMRFTSRFRARDGLEIEAEATWVWTVREGRLARLTLYQDHDEAMAAAEAG
jgi:ketosteroid isomerase-like protein